MKLVTFRTVGDSRLGCLVDGRLVDLNLAYEGYLLSRDHPKARALAGVLVPPDMKDFLAGEDAATDAAKAALDWVAGRDFAPEPLRGLPIVLDESDAHLLAPLSRSEKLICAGRNYKCALERAGQDRSPEPRIFSKFANAICGWDDDVVRPRMTEKLGYEAELAVVIGRRCKHVDVADTGHVIAGYMTFNDVTASDLTKRDGQNTRGKGFDTFAVCGPWLVTADEIPDAHDLSIRLAVDGRVLQDSSTAGMAHRVDDLVSFSSHIFSLVPGDIIATGSPVGLANHHDPEAWLQPGQVMETEIGGLGVCRNRIVDEEI